MRADRHVVMGTGGTAIAGAGIVALVDSQPGTDTVRTCEGLLFAAGSAADLARAVVELGEEAPTSFAIAAADGPGVTTVLVRGNATATIAGDETIRHEPGTSAWAMAEVAERDGIGLSLTGDDTPTGQWLTAGVIAAGAVEVGRLRELPRPQAVVAVSEGGVDFGSLVGQPPPTIEVDRTAAPTATGVLDDREDDRKASTAPYVPVAETVGHIVTSWGDVLPLDAPIVVGRRPASDPIDGVEPRSIVVDDTMLSRHHATFRVADGRLLVVDEGSTNGTTVAVPGGAPAPCAPGRPIEVPVGATVEFGGVLTATHRTGPQEPASC